MRTYGTIRSTFWMRGSGKRLRGNPEAQVLALYLMTCSQGTMSGIFHLALPTVAHETGIALERVLSLLKDIEEIARYDEDDELCWLPNAAREQLGATLAAKDKKRSGLLRELKQFGSHRFAREFGELYGEAYGLGSTSPEPAAVDLECDKEAPSKPLPRGMQSEEAGGEGASKPPGQGQGLGQGSGQGSDQAGGSRGADRPHSEIRSKPEPKQEPTQETPPPRLVAVYDPRGVQAPKAQPRGAEAPQSNPPENPDSWRPRSRQDALNAPIEQRARWAMREQWAAAEYQPQDWPEVQLVAQAFHAAYRLAPAKLGRLDSDKLGTQRIVSLLTQYTPDQLVRVCGVLPSEKISKDRIEKGERPRLGWLSDEVVRTAYAALPGERPKSEAAKRAIEAARKATA